MKRNKKSIFIFIITSALIIASIPIIFITVSLFQREDYIKVEFTPNQMKSCPNHTAWLLLDIKTKTNDLMSNLSLQISTNTSIEMNYKVWEKSPIIKLVEVFLSPNSTHIDKIIEIEALIKSRGISKTDYALVQVINWTVGISPEIEVMREEFVNYLSNYHTNFKINESITWEWLGNPPEILIVEHYLFKSDFWELELARHVMIYPYDWVTIYLRPRSSATPNWSGTINSWTSGNHTIIEVDPPNEIFR